MGSTLKIIFLIIFLRNLLFASDIPFYISSSEEQAIILIDNNETNFHANEWITSYSSGMHIVELKKGLCKSEAVKINLTQNHQIFTINFADRKSIVLFNTEPDGANIIFDGKKIGVTPFKKQFNCTRARITIKKENYITIDTLIQISECDSVVVNKKLENVKGVLTLPRPPLGNPYILDGDSSILSFDKLDTLSLSFKINIGSRHLTWNGDSIYESIDTVIFIKENSQVTIPARGKCNCGFLEVLPNPPSAEIYIDKNKIGDSAISISNLSIGMHQLLLKKKYYFDYSDSVNIKPCKKIRFLPHLEKIDSNRIRKEFENINNKQPPKIAYSLQRGINEGKIKRPKLVLIKTDIRPDITPLFNDIKKLNSDIEYKLLEYQKNKHQIIKLVNYFKIKNAISNSFAKSLSIVNLSLKTILIDLITSIENSIKSQINNRDMSKILFFLAELHYELTGLEFMEKLKEYEKIISQNNNNENVMFPEYDLSNSINIYNEICNKFPDNKFVDDAYYYKALALQKQGQTDEANIVFLELTEKYPASEYYAEANMNIGRFYFEHPKIENDQGYRLAENAYRKVLTNRDHPQFVQALYHLGWCYYMQDRYEEAIASFKFLIEENRLDFDPSKIDQTQIVNPLLSSEAIDYIAISFDEGDNIDKAIEFLQLIGNVDYAAIVMKRMAELREEDLDFPAASAIYKRLLKEYRLSTIAPEASMNLIKNYEDRNLPDSAMLQRDTFFDLFSRGGVWNDVMKKDTILVQYIDSLSIVMGLYVADAEFRKAEATGSQEAYQAAINKYMKVIDKYPNNLASSEALWNIAAISELKLGNKPVAFTYYIKFSQNKKYEKSKREQAALNAIALAQSIIPTGIIEQTGKIDFAAKNMIDAVDNYKTLFPDGSSLVKVLLSQAAIYFNRQIFDKAAEIYTEVIKLCDKNVDAALEATLYLGQCRFGEEKWSNAAASFEKVYSQSADPAQKVVALKLLLQSEFLNAKAIMNSSEYEKAATVFKNIDDRFPGSDYGDIVLFNAAESYEKLEKWQKAAEAFTDLVKRYPSSKYASDALFNAALDYEKCDKINKAADAYETIVDNYSGSDKAKDALFNLGFCYEKLGKMDKMAEVNERYSLLYPGEKDVETMLLRSAAFYARTGVYDKAIIVYRNFIRRFPKTPKSIEAFFMIAKCQYDQNDFENALFSFNTTEQQNSNLILNKMEPNNYYAGEAAYYTGLIKRNKFLNIKLVQPAEKLKNSLKEKSELLNDASKAFQRVIQYQSERMFEAAYRVGELYEDLTTAIRDQERTKLDPLHTAENEKDIMNLCFKVLQNTVIPYTKAMEIADWFDSLSITQQSWVTKSKTSLERNLLTSGEFLNNAILAVQKAPIPKEIIENPIQNFQYQKQVVEMVVEPLKNDVFNYYKQTLSKMDSLKFGDSLLNVCRDEIAKIAYLKARDFDQLSTDILKSTQDLPSNMDPDEKEDLVFQLEDIVYELQDKSIILYETALKTIKELGLVPGKWNAMITEALARLNPDKYGNVYDVKKSSGTNNK